MIWRVYPTGVVRLLRVCCLTAAHSGRIIRGRHFAEFWDCYGNEWRVAEFPPKPGVQDEILRLVSTGEAVLATDEFPEPYCCYRFLRWRTDLDAAREVLVTAIRAGQVALNVDAAEWQCDGAPLDELTSLALSQLLRDGDVYRDLSGSPLRRVHMTVKEF